MVELVLTSNLYQHLTAWPSMMLLLPSAIALTILGSSILSNFISRGLPELAGVRFTRRQRIFNLSMILILALMYNFFLVCHQTKVVPWWSARIDGAGVTVEQSALTSRESGTLTWSQINRIDTRGFGGRSGKASREIILTSASSNAMLALPVGEMTPADNTLVCETLFSHYAVTSTLQEVEKACREKTSGTVVAPVKLTASRE